MVPKIEPFDNYEKIKLCHKGGNTTQADMDFE
jgi:hypothetical protein